MKVRWPMPRRKVAGLLIAAAVVLACIPARYANAVDARLRIVDFDPTEVLSLTAFVGYHVHFEFAADERFVNLGAGDTALIDVGAEANHLLLKPKSPTPGTNLTIITNKRVYHIDYHALARAPHADEATYAVTFRYPVPPPVVAPKISEVRLDGMPSAPNRDYWYCGPPSLRPVSAVDDGLQLRLAFAPDVPLPTIYAVEPDGSETLVNTHVEADTVFVHRLASHFVLRRGTSVGCVVDRNRRATPRRATSGTVDPQTTRAVRKGEP